MLGVAAVQIRCATGVLINLPFRKWNAQQYAQTAIYPPTEHRQQFAHLAVYLANFASSEGGANLDCERRHAEIF